MANNIFKIVLGVLQIALTPAVVCSVIVLYFLGFHDVAVAIGLFGNTTLCLMLLLTMGVSNFKEGIDSIGKKKWYLTNHDLVSRMSHTINTIV